MNDPNVSEAPAVSIIVPVHNQWHATHRCLMSLVEHTRGIRYEIIVVDDGSCDETPQALPQLERVSAVTLKQPRGYAAAANAGAEVAKGKHLLFLSPESQARTGWLEAMLDVLAKEGDGAAAVGCKRVFPDGRIRHAGIYLSYAAPEPVSLFFFDYGLVAPTNDERRLATAISNESLLIRRDRFQAVGGFDSSLGELADVDLCLKLRERGWKIIYTPKAVITHSGIYNESPRERGADYERFLERWQGKTGKLDLHFASQAVKADTKAERPGAVIVVPIHDSARTAIACLENVRMTVGSQDEVVVVDDGSRPATAQALRQFVETYPQAARLVRHDQTQGVAAAARSGLEASDRPYGIVLSPGDKILPGWVDRLVAHLEADEKIGIITPTPGDPTTLPPLQDIHPSATPAKMASLIPAGKPGNVEKVPVPLGPCFAARRGLLLEILAEDREDAFASDPGYPLRVLTERGLTLAAAPDVGIYRIAPGRGYMPQLGAPYLLAQAKIRAGAAERSLSVVVVHDSSAAQLRACIEAILAGAPASAEIVVVDNRQNGDAQALGAVTAGRPVTIVELPAHERIGSARSRGLERAGGGEVLLVDSDVVVTGPMLAKLRSTLSLDGAIGMVAPALSGARPGPQMPAGLCAEGQDRTRFVETVGFENWGDVRVVPRLSARCLLVRREVLDRVGGFDPIYEAAPFCDDDYAIRVRRARFSLVVAYDAHAFCPAPARLDRTGLLQWRASDEAFMHRFAARTSVESSPAAFEALVKSAPFDPKRDRIPLSFEALYNPSIAPLDLGETKPVRFLCIPDWTSKSWQEPVTSYLQTFRPTDPVTLVVRVEPPTQDRVRFAWAEMEGLIRTSGLSPEASPDILFEASALPPADRGGLYRAATAFLPCGDEETHLREAEACGIPALEKVTRETLGAFVKSA